MCGQATQYPLGIAEPSISSGDLYWPAIPRNMTGNALSCQTSRQGRQGLSSCKPLCIRDASGPFESWRILRHAWICRGVTRQIVTRKASNYFRNLTAPRLRGNGLQGYVPANTVIPTGVTVPRKYRCMYHTSGAGKSDEPLGSSRFAPLTISKKGSQIHAGGNTREMGDIIIKDFVILRIF